MKLKFHKKTDVSKWAILESDIAGPQWKVIDCFDTMCIGYIYKDMNEFMKIHLDFIEDSSYRQLNLIPLTANVIPQSWIDSVTNAANLWRESLRTKEEVKCDCGASKTSNTNCHSNWCSMSQGKEASK